MNLPNPSPRRAHRVMLGLAALAISVAIAACGSSTGNSTTTSKTTTSSSAAVSAHGTSPTDRTAFQKCLEQHGFTIPSHPAGGGTSTTHTRTPSAAGATASNPTRQAAFKACGATGQHTNSG
jgi:hypothetical protein